MGDINLPVAGPEDHASIIDPTVVEGVLKA